MEIEKLNEGEILKHEAGAGPAPEMSEQEWRSYQKAYQLHRKVFNGASWFFWIAGLSLVNSLMLWLNLGWNFLAGLAVTQIIDAIFQLIILETGSSSLVIPIIAFALDLIVAGLFALFGYLSIKKYLWVFIVGTVLYVADAILLLIVGGDFLMIGFHAFAIFGLVSGIVALVQLRKLEKTEAAAAQIEPTTTVV